MTPLIELDLVLTDPESASCPRVPVTLRLFIAHRRHHSVDIRDWLTHSWMTLKVSGDPLSEIGTQNEELLSWAIERYIALGGDE